MRDKVHVVEKHTEKKGEYRLFRTQIVQKIPSRIFFTFPESDNV